MNDPLSYRVYRLSRLSDAIFDHRSDRQASVYFWAMFQPILADTPAYSSLFDSLFQLIFCALRERREIKPTSDRRRS